MTHLVKRNLFRLVAFLCVSVQAVAQDQVIHLPHTKHKLVVISHRGNHVDVPENTLAAFKEAIHAGADYVEVDLRTTKDGYLVVLHDSKVDRTTNGSGKISDMTLDEVEKLKVFNQNKKTHRVPEFKEVLKLCKNKINIYLDFKDADVAETWKQIQAEGMEKQVVVYLNKIPQYKQWRSIAPHMPLMTSLFEEVKNADQLRMFLGQVKVEVLDNMSDAAMVAVAKENGVAVWLDVQNPSEGPVSWKEALQKGVQGLQTDKPAALVSYLKENGWRDGMPVEKSLTENTVKRPSYIELKDVKYGDAPGSENLLDAYVPRNHNDSTKVIVYMHGGSWSRGDKTEFPKHLIDELVGKHGYAVVSINYRLVKDGKNLFPAQIEDVQKAMQFLSDKSKKYQYNGNEFALMGGSAGAHLAMLYAYGHDPKKQVRTVVDLWGPTDLTDKAVRQNGTDADNTVIHFLGVADPKAQIASDASPSYFLTKTTGVPTILFHGQDDPLVNVSQSENLYKKLTSLGIPAQLELYPHEKHGVGPAASLDVFSKMVVWLEKYYPSK